VFEIIVIGVDGEQPATEGADALAAASSVFGARRFKPVARRLAPQADFFDITPLAGGLSAIGRRSRQGPVAVLAGGDPLFFGIGRVLIERFGRERVRVLPAVSSMQRAFAACALPWDRACFLSGHGRPLPALDAALAGHECVCVLTDRTNTPQAIAKRLVAAGWEGRARFHVVENAGLTGERLTSASPAEISAQEFGPLNIVIIESLAGPADSHAGHAEDWDFGLAENDIRHSRGLITKDEVRAAVIHRLRLPRRGVFWDIGAGSGSVSVEAARLRPHLSVWACEKNSDELDNIAANRAVFRLSNIEIIAGEAPRALEGKDIPAPDRVFIGGSGGRLEDIVQSAASRLAPEGIIVATAVTAATRAAAPRLFHEAGLAVGMSTLSVSRETYPPGEAGPITFNPITIITGKK